MLDLALLNQVFHRPGRLFDGHAGINPVLIEQIDGIHFEALQRAFGNLLDVLWAAVQTYPSALAGGIKLEPEFGSDHHFSAERSQGLAHKLFVLEGAVHFGGVEEGYAALHRGPEKSDHLLLICRRTVRRGRSHAAEPESRHFEIAFPKFALLHCFSFSLAFR